MKKSLSKKIGIWMLAISLFAFHILFRSVAHAETPAPSWKQVFSKSGECYISFPSTPETIQQSLPLSDGSNRLSYDIYLAPHEDKGVFLLLVATYPTALTGGNEIAGLEGLISGIVNHHADNKLVFADLVQFHEKPAVNFLVEGGNNYFRGNALMIGNKLFLIAMEGVKGDRNEKVFARFLESFKLSK